ncbi:hypothetical protein A4X09_0g3138 [Tilletia walkeri]|uniref:Splicing factor Cactin n=1 Tax=Tilletia walkeri TaxID=117179 RepID=A0A8X7N9Y9_9BASI|nr:hypothetical protein A4X09_0g3138 [Tilletia walkeri]
MPRSPSPEPSSSRRKEGESSRGDRDRDRDHKHRSRHTDGDDDRSRHRPSSSSHHKDDRRKDDRDRDRGGDRDRHRSDRKRDHDYDSEDEEERRRRKERKSRHRDSSVDREREREREKAERKAKKAAKRAQEAEVEEAAARQAAAEALFYSAEDNPFHDANLGQQFKWGKKEDKDKKLGLSLAEARAKDEIRRREAQEEVARLAAKRAQREVDRQLREQEQAKAAREAESAQMAAWVAKEDEFHLEQSRKRSAIRVRNNRALPIDILAINLKWADPMGAHSKKEGSGPRNAADEEDEDDEAGLEIDLDEPYNIFEGLSLQETEQLYRDIQMYLSLEKIEQNVDFWKSMLIVCNDKLEELRSDPGSRPGTSAEAEAMQQPRVDPQVRSEMNVMLASKTPDQLVTLQSSVRAKLASGEPVDVEYWESLLRLIMVWRAKNKLRDLHEVVLQNRIEYLRKKQRDEAKRMQDELEMEFEGDGLGPGGMLGGDNNLDEDDDMEAVAAREAEAADVAEKEAQARLDAEWIEEMDLPPIPDVSKLPYAERRLPIITLSDDRAALVDARKAVLGTAFVPRARAPVSREPAEGEDADLALYKAEASKALDVEEEEFNEAEEILGVGGGGDDAGPSSGANAGGAYQYEDKYRPRKPRYFNRVHTGYEWNKYNQTHYDTDNPPPKVVQGYKFNIFYPDLIDKTKAPSYKIIKEPGHDETVLLRVTAGPPYEDIAFRIVNKPWDHRRGFRSSFDRGVLQLYFNFQRQRYRK